MKVCTFILSLCLYLSSCSAGFSQINYMKMAVVDTCLRMYQEQQVGNEAAALALRDFANSINIENYKIESEASREFLRSLSMLDEKENIISSRIVLALRTNMKGYSSFDAYLMAIVEKANLKVSEALK